MRTFHRLAAGALMLGAASFATAANAGVKLGTLTCHVAGGWGYVLGSSKHLNCDYYGSGGTEEHYVGSLSKFGVDIGYTDGATIVWAVVAPTFHSGPGALQGDYAGATASATIIEGVGAHALVGGLDRSIALQPVSIEGNSGYFNIAAGVGEMHLAEANPSARHAAAIVESHQKEPLHFAVFFDFNRASLSQEARMVVRSAATVAEQNGAMVRVHVAGHTDTVGSDSYNMALSVQRANVVKAEMVHDGLSPTQIAVEGRGFRDPLVATGPDVREPQNRCAMIDVGNPVVSDRRRSLTHMASTL